MSAFDQPRPARPFERPRAWRLLLLTMTLAIASGCGSRGVLPGMGGISRTPHERYAEGLRRAGLDSTALGREWLAAGDSALRAPLAATLPAREVGVYSRSEARAFAYRINLREGQRLRVGLRFVGAPTRVFVDLYEVTADSSRPFRHRLAVDSTTLLPDGSSSMGLEWEARDSVALVLRLQPELLRAGRYELTLTTEAMLAFPVEGRGNGAIQSFFGAERDGGRRDHHGIDIFAPRGTPVVAGTDGVVRSTQPNNLGGNVVWLSDTERGQSLYYAHLDTVIATQGQRVRLGDTLGFVGNSGNARTTAPHLHFGIYRRGRGPVDPLPYVRIVTSRPPALAADTSSLGARAIVRVADAPLRSTPSASGTTLRRAPRETPLVIVGASAGWYRVQLDDGTAGYLASGALRVTGARERDFLLD